MRVAVVGATGNVGTAVLRALADTPEVASVIGVARRMPDTDVAPYSGCDWAAIDIAAAASEGEALRLLRDAFAGVDAVIHLAWLTQPNSKRELLRRVNVEGTARVARAAADAGVGHLVVASSVGVYSPDPDRRRRDESWATNGIGSSHHGVDKAAQERVLDEFSAAHPEIAVTRLRPALTFQADAGYEIQRYFLGGWVPMRALDSVRPPLLAVPKGLRMQAVHADDVGRAYAAAVAKRVPGAFNLCADDILGPQQLADIIDHGRFIELPPRLVRAFMFGGHKAKLIAADESWIDLALSVPMMDNTRAKTELGWQPRYSAAEALESLVRGMIDGCGADSLPLRPRDPDEAHLPEARGSVAEGADAGAGVVGAGAGIAGSGTSGDAAGAPDSPRISSELMGLYLSDHLTGATAGAERIERMSAAYIDTPVYARLSELAEEIRLERAFLHRLIHDLGMRQRSYRQAVSWTLEHIGRLKTNGRVLSRSPMTLVLETELMRGAVMGKLGVWQTLEDNAEELGLDPEVFADLAERTLVQVNTLSEIHEYARKRAFREDGEVFGPHAESDSADEGSSSERSVAEAVAHDHDDALADEWGKESFPASDPPGHY